MSRQDREVGEILGPIVGAAFVLGLAAAFVVAMVGGFDALLAAVAPVLVGCGALVLCVAAWTRGAASAPHTTVERRGRHIAIHTGPTHNRRVTARHEAGHAVVGKARGWRVNGVEIHSDTSATTYMTLPLLYRYDARDDIAVSTAGWRASGTTSGCGSDFAYAHAARDSYPPDQRDAAWREGLRRADAAIFWRGGELGRMARTLHTQDRI